MARESSNAKGAGLLKRQLKRPLKRLRRRKENRRRLATPPGTLLDTKSAAQVSYELFTFSAVAYHEEHGEGIPEDSRIKRAGDVSWLNITGVEDPAMLERIGRDFGVHPLILEDIQNTVQRPKLEDAYGESLFLTLRMLQWEEAVASEQISILLGPGYVISFQERPGDVFDPIRSRIRENKGRVRRGGADYLAYALLDLIVDSYFLILEKLEDQLEQLDTTMELRAERDVPEQAHRIKQEISSVRRAVWPLREITDRLQKQEFSHFGEGMLPYLRDLYDHVLRSIDTLELMRENLASLRDAYQTLVNNDMNSVMRVLTIIATIFIPLTFLAGIYGMNFVHMPELTLPWAYPALLVLMAVIAGAMLLYFRLKRWL